MHKIIGTAAIKANSHPNPVKDPKIDTNIREFNIRDYLTTSSVKEIIDENKEDEDKEHEDKKQNNEQEGEAEAEKAPQMRYLPY